MQLSDLGWDIFFDGHFEPFRSQGFSALRIIRENRGTYLACNEKEELTCAISGKLRFRTGSKSQFPAVGDWIAASVDSNEKKAVIHALLPRKSTFSRKVAGPITDEQVVAANIDTIFIVIGLDLNYNLRSIERYLSLALESGAIPVILLNKSDICPETEARKTEVELIAPGTEVYTLSASQNTGTEFIKKYTRAGETVAFIGPSGTGKSTIINSLLGSERQEVNAVSEMGSRGRHTTTFRELILLPGGGMVIDTPGMRELQVWGDDEGMKQVFDDIEELSIGCRFRDCAHGVEPGCAVQKALNEGTLLPKRLENYLKMKKEFAYLADRQTMKASAIEKSHWKKISQYVKNLKKEDRIH